MRKRLWIWICTGIGLLVVIVAADRLIMPWVTAHGRDIILPDLANLSVDEAASRLTDLGLAVETKSRFSRSKPAGQIIQQIPEPGTRVKSGRIIQMIVSTDQVLIAVPAVVLTTLRDARFTLESQGLEIGSIDTVESHEYPQGIIVGQSVEPGTQVNVGSRVDLSVSRGHDLLEAKVPFVVDRSLVEAKAIIADAGMRLGKITKKYSENLLPGTVLEQSLDSAKSVAPLTPLDLVVSSADHADE